MKLPFTWRHSKHDRQPEIDLARIGELISVAPMGKAPDPSVEQWAETVLRFSNVELFTGDQNVIIFGSKAMGRVAVMRRIAQLMNLRFNAEHRAAPLRVYRSNGLSLNGI